MLNWIRRWLYVVATLGAFAIASWWFVQQTTSYRRLDTLLRHHPVVAGQVGEVSSIRLPFFGYGVDVTDARVDPNFNVRVTGSKGEAWVHAEFVDGAISDASLNTADGSTIPLVIQR
jgi:hypothetical protein